jgi:acyl dehydratase
MCTIRSNLDRRSFLKIGAAAAAVPFYLRGPVLSTLSAACASPGAGSILPGIYSDAEKKMLMETDLLMDSLVGWGKAEKYRVDREQSLKGYAAFTDPENPLYNDDEYANTTRWGGLIAVPTYAAKMGISEYQMPSTPACGNKTMTLLGEDIDFYRPIRKKDRFKVWNRRPMYRDVTPEHGKGPRTFIVRVSDVDVINQEDDLVYSYKNYIEQYFWPAGPPDAEPMKEYAYTKEELEYLDGLEAAETVRGAKIRYFEDVRVGDVICPVVLGPITDTILTDFRNANMAGISGPMEMPMPPGGGEDHRRASLRQFEKDPETGRFHIAFGSHAARSARRQGAARAYSGASLSRAMLGRLVTNWMGDDGFLRKFHYRRLRRDFIGDAMIVRGVVADKRVRGGEHLVDIDAWMENMRGNVTGSASMSVDLFTKNPPAERDEV